MTSWFIANLLRDIDSQTAHDQAKYHHTAALRLPDQPLDAIHEPETGRPVGSGLFWRRGDLQGREGDR